LFDAEMFTRFFIVNIFCILVRSLHLTRSEVLCDLVVGKNVNWLTARIKMGVKILS
jgi:hypothetical protein